MRTQGLGNAQSGSFGAKQKLALEGIHQAYCISFPIKEPYGPARPAPLINQLMELQESTPRQEADFNNGIPRKEWY